MNSGEIQDAFPLSRVQSGMLFHALESPDTDVYVSYIEVTIRGELNPARFEKAWLSVLNRHSSLGAAFVWDGLEQPLQAIVSIKELDWKNHQWPAQSDKQREQALQDLIVAQRSVPFDLTTPPLCRFHLIQHTNSEWTLVWVIHHLLADGWSTPIVLRDVLAAYSEDPHSEKPLSALSFADYIRWASERDATSATEHWSKYLVGSTPTPVKLARPTARIEPAQSAPIPEVRMALTALQSDAINSACRRAQVTLSSLVHGAWALVLNAYADNDEVLFGSTSSGRASALPGIQDAVGMFLNTLPLRVSIPESQTWQEWLSQIGQTLQRNAALDQIDLTQIQSMVQLDRDEPLFESIVVIEGHASDEMLRSPDQQLVISNIRYSTHSNFPLAVLFFPGSAHEVAIVFDQRRYKRADIDHLTQCLVRTLIALADNLNGAAHQLPVLDHEALDKVSTGNHKTTIAHTDVVSWFESVSTTHAQSVAVCCGAESITYAALNERANRVASYLRENTQSPTDGNVVALVVNRSIDQIVGMLGILKAGLAYLPLDPAYPSERITGALVASKVRVVLTQVDHTALITDDAATVLLMSDAVTSDDTARPKTVTVADEDRLAYLIYTSGSTGESKGVQITHQNLMYSTQARIDYYNESPASFLLLSSVAFDSSVVGVYWTLLTGGRLVLPEPGEEKDMARISALIRKHQVTHTLTLPSLYSLILRFAPPNELNSMSSVIVAGEACSPSLVSEHQSRHADVRLFNEYGPTEATVWASVYEATQPQQTVVPIGRPIGDTLLLVLNSDNQPAPLGVEGTIWIGGRGVGPGYYRAQALTDERFIKNPTDSAEHYPVLYNTGDRGYWREDSQLVFAGRADRQLKIRGYRVEPGEIESALLASDAVREALVVPRTASMHPPTDEQLVQLLSSLPESEANALIDSVTDSMRNPQ